MAGKDAYDKQHDADLAKLKARINYLYNQFAKEVGQLSNLIEAGGGIPADKPFNISDYPATEARLKKLIKKLAKEIDVCIVNGVKGQWTLANKKNNELCNVVFGNLIDQLTKEQRRYYYTNNKPALDAFLARRVKGMNLSQRVWEYVDESRGMIESTLELGIKTGEAATAIARDLKQYLKFPDKLFRRVRDNEGNLHLSKNAAAFHPGQGVYRSSYKNALRLAGTETNIAYRTADHLRHVQLDFVVGIEIHLSNNHTCLDSKGRPQPFFDICDELKGKYPKWFQFSGWHPQCRCFVTTILKTPEEVARDADGIDRGSVNEVKEMPPQWNAWVQRNEDRIARAEAKGTLPYFLRDNEWAWKEGVEMPNAKKTAQQQAIIRHASRTPEQIEDIKRRWNERQTVYNDAKIVLGLLDSVPDLEEWWKGTDELAGYRRLREMYDTGRFGSYSEMSSQAKDMLGALRSLRDEFKVLDNPWEVLKKYNPFRAMNARDNALKTMSKYDGYSDKEKVDKYRYEAEYIEKFKKGAFSTWEVVRDAYLKAARELEWKILWEGAKAKLDTLATSPYAPVDLVDHARTLLGHDKAAFDDVVSMIEKEVRFGESKKAIEDLLAKWPKLLANLNPDIQTALTQKDPDIVDYYIKMAGIVIKQWEELVEDHAKPLLNSVDVGEPAKEAIRKAIDEQSIGKLTGAINRAEKEQQVKKEAATILRPGNVAILRGLGFGSYIDDIKEDLANGDFNGAGIFIDAAKKKLEDWKALIDEAADLMREVPGKYADPLLEASLKYDRAALVVALTKARDYKDNIMPLIEELKALRGKKESVRQALEKRRQELKAKRADIAKRKKENRDKLALYVSNYTAIFGTKPVLGQATQYDVLEAEYRKLLNEAKALRSDEAKYDEAALSFKSWDVWVADAQAAIDDGIVEAAKEAIEELKDTVRKAEMQSGLSSVETLTDAEIDGLIHYYENVSVQEMDDLLRPQTEAAWKVFSEEEKRMVTKYTQTYCYLNEPLRGMRYSGSQGGFEHDKDLLTSALDKVRTQQRFVIRRGVDDYLIPELSKRLSSVNVGDEFAERGFLSTGAHRNCGFRQSYNLIIVVPRGVSGIYAEPFSHYGRGSTYSYTGNIWDGQTKQTFYSGYSGEFEWIGNRGTKFRVYRKDGRDIYLVVIGEDRNYTLPSP